MPTDTPPPDFSDAPPPPDPSPDSARPHTFFSPNTAPIHIPGAGTMGIAILIVSLSILFAASVLIYLLLRFVFWSDRIWVPAGMPPLPRTLWLSTGIILLTSVTIQYARNAVRRDHQVALVRGLSATLGLAFLFLLLQSWNWYEVFVAIPPNFDHTGPYLGFFYMLTSLHAAHVIGGIIPLIIVLIHARRQRYSANFHPGVRYCTMYFHFLDIIWVVLFICIYLL